MQCIFCSKPLHLGNVYCSVQCQQDHSWDKRKKKFESTGMWEGVTHETVITRRLKRYLKETRGMRCQICGITEWMGEEVPLVLDHIDGNSARDGLDNVRLVCGNCDMQLPTYKSKNRGRGRANRRKQI